MLEVEMDGNVAVVTIDNPPMNVLCTPLLQEFNRVLTGLKGGDVRVVILTGAGKAFVAGADINEMSGLDPEGAYNFSLLGQEVLSRIESLPKPVIAAVNGFALGGGTELALSCDFIIASEKARFGQPEVNLGLIPGFGGTQRLPRRIHPNMARELIYSGGMIDAQEALRIGLANRVLPLDGFLDGVKEIASNIASRGPEAVKLSKEAINRGLDTTLVEGLVMEAERFREVFRTEDKGEGLTAFVEKRKPDFKGR